MRNDTICLWAACDCTIQKQWTEKSSRNHKVNEKHGGLMTKLNESVKRRYKKKKLWFAYQYVPFLKKGNSLYK